ncbi:MAG: hypothetical protein DRI90_15905 [Deltaproteobacteria bacterium]|nr:MAG: hypothetical protein DRI90_15905 [Deltaproteobacteria bacterium]
MGSLATALMAFATTGLLTVAGCNALLDIDHIDFGDGQGGAGTGGGGTGGDGATTTTTTAGGGGSGAEGGGGGTGGAPAEDCTNGVDDNDDTLVDCEDPLCNSYSCVEQTIPASWSGLVVLFVGTSAPSCSGHWPVLSFNADSGTVSAAPASCGNCTCNSPQGVSCPVASTSFWTGSNCNGTADLTQTPSAPNVCTAVSNATLGYLSAQTATVVPSGGTCSHNGGGFTLPPASFSAEAVLCEGATVGAGCPGTEACTPPAGSTFESGVCIYRDGNHACSAPFTVKHTIYTSIDDGRDCTNCTCGSPSGVTCTSTTQLYEGVTNSTCTGTPVVLPHPSSCTSVALAGSMAFIPGSVTGGSCSASGGIPTGTATPGDQVSVCCTP